jgi:isochorismate synthase
MFDRLNGQFARAMVWRGREEQDLWFAFGEAQTFPTLQAARDLLSRLPLTGDESGIRPRCFATIAFDPDGADDQSIWTGFPARSCWLPAIQLCLRGNSAQVFRCGDGLGIPLDEPESADTGSAATACIASRRAHTSPAEWEDQIYAIQRRIQAGDIEKAVLARVDSLSGTTPWPVPAILQRLTAPASAEFAFAVRYGHSIFLGKSPERLFRVDGMRVETESLAGTASVENPPPRTLLHSDKDALEQSVVTRFIRRELQPLCEDGLRQEPVAVKDLSYARHLHTRIHGTLRSAVSLDNLLSALHPTPAVCGEPRDAARRLIQSLEPLPRGLYSGALGWVDGQSADFAVGIRSALLRERDAWLFSGAGIVAGSDPVNEWEETALKMRPMLSALGCER